MVYIIVESIYLRTHATSKEIAMSKIGGTLFLYDSENMKVPVSQMRKYKTPRINLEKMTESLKKRFRDAHHHFVSFGRRYFNKDDKRNENIDKYNARLQSLQYSIVEKTARLKSSSIINNGEEIEYEYEDCDMDGEIIHFIHTVGKNYDRIVMISGDSDMKPALDFVMKEYNVEIWIVAHKETISNLYRDYNVINIGDLV
jgi:uncharacterized LabA/DUF88 family protein